MMDGDNPQSEVPTPDSSDPMLLLAECRLCPRNCGVNRLKGETGFCGVAAEPLLSSAGPHFGEEPPLVGRGGSGTIFFAGCNLACAFCQNYEISHLREGRRVGPRPLAATMIRLQERGCHNINFVTPTHVVPQILVALRMARQAGLTVPGVYNSGGYDSVPTLRLLEGQMEIYMPDAKYLDPAAAAKYSSARDYPDVVKAALREMHRQVGDLEIAEGLAVRGLLVRHLVMPGMTEDSLRVVDFLADEISPNTYLNIMAQYRPCYHADRFPEIDRRPSWGEIERVRRHARKKGLRLSE
jgi:putative pyruvate formate lyase activating enzyme